MPRPIALVTGASAGIGAVFARELARRGHDLILVARRTGPMESLAEELRGLGADAHVLSWDLADPEAGWRLAEEIGRRGLHVDLLINNAGFGIGGAFMAADGPRLAQMLQLNVVTLTTLCHAFLPRMRERGHGAIINVASVAGFQAMPHFAVYAASKAYVLHFSEALAEEVRAAGITVQALCPGSTQSEFFDVAGVDTSSRQLMPAEQVVKLSLDALATRQVVVIPGRVNQAVARVGRLLPRAIVTRAAGKLMKGD